jgi:hypothetical protein
MTRRGDNAHFFHAPVVRRAQPEILTIFLEMFPNETSDSSVGRTGDARSFRPDYRPYEISQNCFSYMYLHKKINNFVDSKHFLYSIITCRGDNAHGFYARVARRASARYPGDYFRNVFQWNLVFVHWTNGRFSIFQIELSPLHSPLGRRFYKNQHARVARDGRQPFQTGLSPVHSPLIDVFTEISRCAAAFRRAARQ